MTELESTAIIVRPSVLPSTPQFNIMRDLALRLASARGFLPDHYFTGNGEERFAKVLAAIEYGRAVGIEPMIALQNLQFIDGKIGASALLIGAQLRRAGYKIKTSWFDDQGRAVAKESPQLHGCKVVLTKSGEETGDGTFSLGDAQRAGLIRDRSGWQRHPKDMLYARALTQAARQGAQDAVLGMAYTLEELSPEATVDEDGQVTGEIPITQALPETVTALEEAVKPQAEPVSPAVTSEAVPVPQASGSDSTPPPTSVEVSPAASAGAGMKNEATTPPPPQTPTAAPERSARSVGPKPKRQNVVQAPTKSATAPAHPDDAFHAREAVPLSAAPPELPDEADQEDEGQRVYMRTLRQDLRERAAMLAHVNAILRNTLEYAAKGQPLEPVPPATPSEQSDEGLTRLIERDNPGQTLATLGEAGLEACLKVVEANLAKKRAIMAERGIEDE